MIGQRQQPVYKWMGLILAAAIMALAFSRILQPGYDLYIWFYPAARSILQGQFSYAQIPRLNNPPWILLLLTPFSVLPPAVMHGLLVSVTVLAVLGVMRDYRRFKVSFPLAVISMPMLAAIWNGQLEFISLLGASLGFAAVYRRQPLRLSLALLLMAAKPQETWLIALLLLVGSWRQWSRSDWAKILLPAAGVAIVTSAWLGTDWVTRMVSGTATYANDWENISIWKFGQTTLGFAGLVLWGCIGAVTAWALWRTRLSRLGLAFAAVSGNLLSPYLTAPHLLVTLCFGWGLLFDRSWRWGALAYLASLTPLLRITTGNQDLNPLDVIFPLVVFVGLLAHSNLLQRGQSEAPA